MMAIDLVERYINGEDVEPYDIVRLEDNEAFMKNVIKVSKDPKMFFMCSERLVTDDEFVYDVLDIFKDDLEKATVIADTYLSKLHPNEIESRETTEEFIDRIKSMQMNIYMASLEQKLSKLKGERVIVQPGNGRFTLAAILLFSKEMATIDTILSYNEDKKDELGEGFLFILDQYGGNKIITDFFAKRMIEEDFQLSGYTGNGQNIETFIHGRCRSFREIEDIGVNNFIINIASSRDAFLGDYLRANPNLILDVKDAIMRVGKRWDYYMDNLNQYRVTQFEGELADYLESDSNFSDINIDDIIKFTAVRLGKEKEFKKFDSTYPEERDVSQFNKISDINTYKALKYAEMLGRSLFSTDVRDTTLNDYDDMVDKTDTKAEVVKFRIV